MEQYMTTILFPARIAVFGGFSELLMHGHMDGRTYEHALFRDARTHLKSEKGSLRWKGGKKERKKRRNERKKRNKLVENNL